MEMNLQMRNIIATSSGTRAEDDVLMVPIPHHEPGPAQATICSGKGPKFYPPSSLLSSRIGYVKRLGAMKNSDHNTITISEPQICRICDFDEKEHSEDVLVELGCSCKGRLSRMHRTCILKWYGVRMLLQKLNKSELCNYTEVANSQREESFPPPCSRGALALVMATTILGVGLSAFLIHHFYGDAAFH